MTKQNNYSRLLRKLEIHRSKIPTFINNTITKHKMNWDTFQHISNCIYLLIGDKILTPTNLGYIWDEIEYQLDLIMRNEHKSGIQLIKLLITNLLEYIDICHQYELYETLHNFNFIKDKMSQLYKN